VVYVCDDAEVANVIELQVGSRVFLREGGGRNIDNITVRPHSSPSGAAVAGEQKRRWRLLPALR